jgi:hypothetical protein
VQRNINEAGEKDQNAGDTVEERGKSKVKRQKSKMGVVCGAYSYE